jgi:2-dehydro-3-deoxygluconokinase
MRALGAVGEGLVEIGLESPPDPSTTLGYGGDAANTTVMAALLGTPSRLAGRVGDDGLGRRLLGFWQDSGVDASHVVVDAGGPTGIYVNERGVEGLHRFDYHRRGSAGSRLEPADLDDRFFHGLGALHVTGVTLAVSTSSEEAGREALRRARDAGALRSFAVNHRPALGGDPATLAAVAGTVDIVFLSEAERAALGTPTVGEVVLTLGAAGAAVCVDGLWTEVSAPDVTVVDTAGAGDALAGAYLASRLAGADAPAALRVGVTAASLSCRARGCALSYPDADGVAALLARLPGI